MNIPGIGGLPPGGNATQPGYGPQDPNVKMLTNAMESCYVKTVMAGGAGFALGGLFGMFMASMAYDTPFHTATVPSDAKTPANSSPSAAATGAKPPASIPANPSAAAGTTNIAPSSVPASSTPSVTAAVKAHQAAAPATSTTIPTAATSAPLPRPNPLASAHASGAAAAASQLGTAASGTEAVAVSSLPLSQQLKHGFKDMGQRSFSSAKNFAKVGALFSGIECGIEGIRAKNDIFNGTAAGCLAGGILARSGGPSGAAVGCVGFAAFSAAIDTWLRQPSDE